MRVLIIIAVALVSLIGLTYLANAETITIKKDKPQVGEALYDYEPAKINVCVNAWQSGNVYHEYIDVMDKRLGWINKNYWIFYQGKHFRYTIDIIQEMAHKKALVTDSISVTCDYAKERKKK